MSSVAPDARTRPDAARPRVAVQGDPGCFSHAAALRHFGALDLVPCLDFEALFDAVLEGRADVACVPVENALAGAVTDTLDLLVRRPVHAIAEAYVRVEMCLAVRPGTRLEQIRAVASHPVALRQCRRYLGALEGVEEIVARDTAGSIRDLMQGTGSGEPVPWNAAIGPALAAKLYGAELLAREIEDHPRNFTRFLIVAAGETVPGDVPGGNHPDGGVPKASLAFTLPHRPGSLHEALGIFAGAGLDLTRVESRPIPGRPWEYRFFVDVRGTEGEAWREAQGALAGLASELRVIGVYPEARAP
jgi:prephenate dehydratase